jgi:hypothetical protein
MIVTMTITMTNLDIFHLTIMKTFHDYFINSLLSPTQFDNYEDIP